MIQPDSLPMTAIVAANRPEAQPPTVLTRLADIPEEEIWLAMQKSARTRRAYRLDVQHFMATLHITTSDELRQVEGVLGVALTGWKAKLVESKAG